MKKINFLLIGCALGLIISCTEKAADGGTVLRDTEREDVPDRGVDLDWGLERDDYRGRMNTRVQELDMEIEEDKRMAKSEKDAKKRLEYENRIREKESRKSKFQESMNRLEQQTEEGWRNFKTEMDELFSGDKDNNRMDR